MSEQENNIFLNHTESENDQDVAKQPNINNNNNKNDLSSYIFKNGNKIVISGKNLQKEENLNILNQFR